MKGLAELLFAPWPALCAALLGTQLLDRLVRPAPAGARRIAAGQLIQFGLVMLVYTLLLAVCQRPWFAAALTLAGHLLLVLVNNAKYRALREPFVFTDFGLFSQALTHPRLYLPFFGVLPAAAGVLAFGLMLYLGLTLESPILMPDSMGTFALAVALPLAAAGVLLAIGTRLAPPPDLDVTPDLHRFGLLASLWLYRLTEHRHDPDHPGHPARTIASFRIDATRNTPRPHILAIQSESFFDVRRLHPAIRPELLANFDAACRQASAHGRLSVPAWGANTMRTEFAFLSGLADEHLGVHRFNPYRHFAHRPWPTLASQLRDAGYRTVCVHPHPASFFGRDRVFPQLGFDAFIDIRAFPDAPRCGPYISDAALTARIRDLLAEATQPTFLFVITMENHGPLHLEQVAAADAVHLYQTPPPAGFDDLTVYLRHLQNADRMIGELLTLLEAAADDVVLCYFGDHVPSMPRVYAACGFEDGRSDYLIWRRGGATAPAQDLKAEQLGQRLLTVAGLTHAA